MLYVIRKLNRGSHGWQPSVANSQIDTNGARWRWIRNLAAPSRLHRPRLRLYRCISLAWTAVRGLVRHSRHGSVRRRVSVDVNMATRAAFDCMFSCGSGLRRWDLLVAVVARAMASRPSVHSFRHACVGAGDDTADSIPQKTLAHTEFSTSK